MKDKTEEEYRKVFEKYNNCIYNDEGYCRLLKHDVGVNGHSILGHCKNCPYGNDKESRLFKDKLKRLRIGGKKKNEKKQ